MIDQQLATQDPGQDVAMPTTDQPVQTEAPVQEAPQEDSAQSTQDGLPNEASERTRTQFEKLQTQLREERAKREYAENVFRSLTPQKTVEPTPPAPFIDPNTGFLNEQALNDVQRRAIEAEQRASHTENQFNQYMIEQEKKEAFSAHPDLDPDSSKFNQKVSNITRSILTDSMLNPNDYGGKQLSFKQAADLAKELGKPVLDKARQEGAQQALEQLTPKEQASLDATSVPTRRSDTQGDIGELGIRTRKGDLSAITDRLKGVPWS